MVLKIEADDVHHKTEVGGVALNVPSDSQLRIEYAALLERVATRAPDARVRGVRVERMASGLIELIVGGRNDPLFGPVVVTGLGGVLAEALQDVSNRSGAGRRHGSAGHAGRTARFSAAGCIPRS